jgi:predicted ester cyclase
MSRFKISLAAPFLALVVAITSIIALTAQVGAQDDMEQAHKAVVARVIDEAFNQGIFDVFDEDFAPDYVVHSPDGDGNAEDFMGFIMAARAAFPDLQATADPVIAEGEWVALRFTMTGTFENELAFLPEAIPPTGSPVVLTVNVILSFNEDGQIAEEWDESDNLGWLTQLGVLPPMEESM